MDTSKFIELLRAKIEEANRNVAEIEQFKLVGQRTFGYKANYYDEEQVEGALLKLSQWQQVIQDVLKSYYHSDQHDNYIRFGKTINRVKEGFDYKVEIPKEYRRGITVLSGILESLELLGDLSMGAHEQSSAIAKPKKIFISHSKNDEEFVTELIRLLRLVGFERQEIFCSSIPGYWIGDGKKFLDEIKTHFVDYDLFVIFVHSPRFYDSHIALNEMGAAWVLQSDHSSFLTSDMEFKKMDAVVNNAEISVKVNADDAKPRMTSWMERILKWFGKPMVDINLWESERDDFLKKVNGIIYTSIEDEPKSQAHKLSKEEEDRLKKWIDSGDNTMFQAWFVGGSATFGLGAMNQYVVEAGREMAKWQGFFKRLLSMGLIEETGRDNHGHPKYRLTESAYTYFENKQS